MTHGDGVLDSGDERRGTCFPCTLPLRVRLFSRGVTAPMTLSWWGSASMELVGFITLITIPAGIPSAIRRHGFLSPLLLRLLFLDILSDRRALGRSCGLPGVCALGVVPGSTLLHMVSHGCDIDNKGPTSEGMV